MNEPAPATRTKRVLAGLGGCAAALALVALNIGGTEYFLPFFKIGLVCILSPVAVILLILPPKKPALAFLIGATLGFLGVPILMLYITSHI